MMLKEFPCSVATRGFVRGYRVAHFSMDPNEALPVKLFTPRAEQSLQFFIRGHEEVEYPDGERFRRLCAVTGSHDEITRRTVSSEFLMLQVAFEPGALYRLCRVSGAELHNRYLDAADILGAGALATAERLSETTSLAEQIAIVDAFIAQRIALAVPPGPVDLALQRLRIDPAAPVTHLASVACLSLRQFERASVERIGVSPKLALRLSRFDRAFNSKLQFPRRDWTQIALDCGYHDYQHMVRDFREFARCTPPQLLRAHASAPECRLGLRQSFDVSYPG